MSNLNPFRPGDPSWHSKYFGPFYLALYANHMLSPMETGWEAEFIGTALELRAGARVLDVPCGFGRHLLRLRKAGFHAVGLDLSLLYLRHARSISAGRRVGPAPVTCGDMARLPFSDASFDAVANLFNSFGYFNDDAPDGSRSNRGMLREIARVLRPDGRFLIDVPDRDSLIEIVATQPRTHCAGDGWEIQEEWRFDPETLRIHNRTRFILGDDSQDTGYDVRLYSREELEEELRAAGLTPWKFWSDLHRDADETSGDRLVIAARKTPFPCS